VKAFATKTAPLTARQTGSRNSVSEQRYFKVDYAQTDFNQQPSLQNLKSDVYKTIGFSMGFAQYFSKY
jgi:hypothetical protein